MNLFDIIKQKISILDVANKYASLKKAGNYWKGKCPFHSEKTASFTVSPIKEIYYCFGCHEGGDVISFIAKVENCSQIQAAKFLAEEYKIELPQSSDFFKPEKNQEEKKNYYHICATIAKWCHENLLKDNNALAYLKSRGININSINLFMLGYFPDGIKALKDLASSMQKENILLQDLLNIKFLIESKNIYSPFEDRIIFPIKDHLGRTCGFGGRIFKKQDERAKYYNSHEHEFFAKSSILYGFDKAKKNIQQLSSVFLVEGYIDVIAMSQNNYQNTIATLGTACTPEHIKQLARYTQKIYLIYDSDKAGQNAISKVIELCLQENIDLYVVTLSNGEDPASLLAKNIDIAEFINKAEDAFDFLINFLGSDFETNGLGQKLEITQKFIGILSKLNNELKEDILIQKLSGKLNIPFNTLKHELKKSKIKYVNIPESSKLDQVSKVDQNLKLKAAQLDKITLLEKKLFSAIILNNDIDKDEDLEFLIKFLPESLNLLIKKINLVKSHSQEENSNNNELSSLNNNQEVKDIKIIFNHLEEEEKNIVSKILIESDFENNQNSFKELTTQFLKIKWKEFISNIKLKIKIAQTEGNNNLIKKLLADLDLFRQKLLQRGIS